MGRCLCDCGVSKNPPALRASSPSLPEAGSQGSLRSPVPFAPYKGMFNAHHLL